MYNKCVGNLRKAHIEAVLIGDDAHTESYVWKSFQQGIKAICRKPHCSEEHNKDKTLIQNQGVKILLFTGQFQNTAAIYRSNQNKYAFV